MGTQSADKVCIELLTLEDRNKRKIRLARCRGPGEADLLQLKNVRLRTVKFLKSDGRRPSLSGHPGSGLPGCKRFGEGPVSWRTFFYGHNGSRAIDVDDRDVEPLTFLEQLNIALHVGVGGREFDREDALHRLDGELGQRSTRHLLGWFHHNSGHAADTATRKTCRQIEHDFDGVARRQSVVDVSTKQPSHGCPPFGDFHIGAHRKFRGVARPKRHGFGPPRNQAEVTLALRIG